MPRTKLTAGSALVVFVSAFALALLAGGCDSNTSLRVGHDDGLAGPGGGLPSGGLRGTGGWFGTGGAGGKTLGSGGSSHSGGSGGSPNSGNVNAQGRNTLTASCVSGPAASSNCKAQQDYEACITRQCDGPLKVCLGSGYASGSFSGPCGSIMKCILACPCNGFATSCESQCSMNPPPNCNSCMNGIFMSCQAKSTCVQADCSNPDSGGSGGNSGSGACTEALRCCYDLAGSSGGADGYKQQCDMLASMGDAVCSQVLNAWWQAGFCPPVLF